MKLTFNPDAVLWAAAKSAAAKDGLVFSRWLERAVGEYSNRLPIRIAGRNSIPAKRDPQQVQFTCDEHVWAKGKACAVDEGKQSGRWLEDAIAAKLVKQLGVQKYKALWRREGK